MRSLKFGLLSVPFFLMACSKPFPIEDALYAEYKAIVCQIPTGQVTPGLLARQLELNKIFEDRLKKEGAPSADWIQKHSLKLAETLDLKTCGNATQAPIQAPSSAAPVAAPVAGLSGPMSQFDGVWHFNPDKSRAANAGADEMTRAILDGTLLGLTVQNANSAGMKIQGGQVQDGTTRCTLEAAGSGANAAANCVNPVDRSIVAELSLMGSGDLQFKTMGLNIVFEKR